MTGDGPPVLLCQQPEDLPLAAEELTRLRWSLRIGFELPSEPWDLTSRAWACTGAINGAHEAQQATWALVRGCALVLAIGAQAPLDLLDDLERGGSVRRYVDPSPPSPLTPDEASLLASLATGCSIRQAAADLYLSNRTAQRRLADTRRKLGVRTTRQAVLAWSHRPEP